ncbi:MAG TPA: hypothetical protein VGE37_00700, partial [Archangium sp.]
YNSSGTCSGGSCTYGSTDTTCSSGCSGGACLGCNAATCPNGCCSGNICRVNQFSLCGTAGGACVACDYSRANQCLGGVCKCGPNNQCGSLRYCEGVAPDGICIREDTCDPICP